MSIDASIGTGAGNFEDDRAKRRFGIPEALKRAQEYLSRAGAAFAETTTPVKEAVSAKRVELDEQQFAALKKEVDAIFLQIHKRNPNLYTVAWRSNKLDSFIETHKNINLAMQDFRDFLESLLKSPASRPMKKETMIVDSLEGS